MKILLTGSSGFFGRNFLDRIDKKKIKGNIFSCRPKGFFGIKGDTLPVEDPLPDMKKSCYLEMKGLTEKDIEKIINESKYKLYG